MRFSKQRREGAALTVDDPVSKQVGNKQECLIGDMKRLWRSLEGQEDVGAGGGKGEEGGNKVMGDMKLLWKSFVGPLPDSAAGQV